tara:strand:- start:4121 stop:7894 length:3774 start_codon:yes stop_codon:yes gene_type:complete
MANKKLIQGQPKFNDLSQYSFELDETVFNYTSSIGLPVEYDKFQNKDLYTKAVGDDVNEAILARNLKAQGDSFIRVDELYVARTDSRESKHNRVQGYLFSQKRFNPTGASYNDMVDNMTSDLEFFDQEFGERDRDLGNMTRLEGNNILFNLKTGPELGDFQNMNESFNPTTSLELVEPENTQDDLNTKVFDENQSNPIYFCFRLKGDKDRWIGTDVRRKRYVVYRIDNFDLFDYVGDFASGKTTQFNINTLEKVLDVQGGGGSGGVESAAHKITTLSITINTSMQGVNNWEDGQGNIGPDEEQFERFFGAVTPPYRIEQYNMTIDDLLLINPDRQLRNNLSSGNKLDGSVTNDDGSPIGFPDFFPLTNINILNEDKTITQDVDLQTYHTSVQKRFKASAPATVALNYSIIDPVNEQPFFQNYFSFVIDWDDKDDKIKTLQDWINTRPETVEEVRELQENNLYIPKIFDNEENHFNTSPSAGDGSPGDIHPLILLTGDKPDFDINDFGSNEPIRPGTTTQPFSSFSNHKLFTQLLHYYLRGGTMAAPNTIVDLDIGGSPTFYQDGNSIIFETGYNWEYMTDMVIELFNAYAFNENNNGMSNHFIYFLYNINGTSGAFSNTVDKLIEIMQERFPEYRNLRLIDLQTASNPTNNPKFGWVYNTGGDSTTFQNYSEGWMPYPIGDFIHTMTLSYRTADSEGTLTYDFQTNTYTTSGIKTIKSIVISYDSETNQLGRWKLVTSRLFLDIPVNQYPDFGELGGSDYTTIPWPYTTPVIGGVDEDSKYKKSVRDTLSGGKIGDSDIIDEKFLVNDRDNDELGKSITKFDLEQCRYFNKSYDMNKLLNIPIESTLTNTVYNTDDSHLQTLEGYNGQGMSDYELGLLYPGQWINYGRPDIAAYIQSIDENIPFNNLGGNTQNQVMSQTGGITGGGQIMGGGTGISDFGDVIGIEGEPEGFSPDIGTQLIGPGEGGTYNPPELRVTNPVNGEKFQADDEGMGFIDIRWEEDHIYNDSVNIQLLKKENGTLSVVTLIAAATPGIVAGGAPGRRLFRAYLGQVNDGIMFDPPPGDNYTIGVFRNGTPAVGAYMGGVLSTDLEYDINNIATFRIVAPQEEIPLVPGEDIIITDTPVIESEFSADPEGTTNRPLETFANPDYEVVTTTVLTPYTNTDFWNGSTTSQTFPEETSVGQIFINENQDNDLKQSCKLELNTGELSGKSIFDSSGNSNKGLLIGDYKVKKTRKGEPMRRDSFIKVPKKTDNKKGAL